MTIRTTHRDGGIAKVDSAAATAAAATSTATLSAEANYLTHISGILITGGGATAASIVEATVTGLPTTLKIAIPVPAGVTAGITPISIPFSPPLPASADNTAIAVIMPSFGAGNTKADVSVWGYRVPTG
jgi:hypothetical protein